MTTKAIEAGARAIESKRAELQNAPLARIYGDLAKACIEAAIASGELVPASAVAKSDLDHLNDALGNSIDGYIKQVTASAVAAERERCARKCEAVMPNESVMVNGTPYVRYHDLKKEIKRRADEIRTLEPAGEYVLGWRDNGNSGEPNV
jgi:hypothetical protein